VSTGRILWRAWITLLFLVVVSPVWLETDAYRIAAALLVFWGIFVFMTTGYRASIGWIGWLCLAWVGWVAIRYLLVLQQGTAQSYGTSEGIFLLPAMYMTTGYAMFLYRDLLGRTVHLFLAISLVAAAVTLDYATLFDGEFHDFLWTNNTIHSSVCGGLLILAGINIWLWASHAVTDPRRRHLIEGAALLVIALCLLGLFGAKSKGVWVALLLACLVQALMSWRTLAGRMSAGRAGVVALALGLFALGFAWTNQDTIAPASGSLGGIVTGVMENGDLLGTLREAIASGAVPHNTHVRLVLWQNALEVWAAAPLLGSGIGWLDLFNHAHYRDTGFDVVHNGYLEIAMRYGLLGLAFYATLYAWALAQSRRAAAAGLVPREAHVFHAVSLAFFLITIMTNSNTRLAIGESLMLVSAAFGFYCSYRLQYAGALAAGDSGRGLPQRTTDAKAAQRAAAGAKPDAAT